MDTPRDTLSETLSESPSRDLRCTNCGHVIAGDKVVSPPPCPECGAPFSWEFVAVDEDVAHAEHEDEARSEN